MIKLLLSFVCIVSLVSCSDSISRLTGDIEIKSEIGVKSLQFSGVSISSLKQKNKGKEWNIEIETISNHEPNEIVFFMENGNKIRHPLKEPILARKTLIGISNEKISESTVSVYHY